MKDINANKLLAEVMGWKEDSEYEKYVPKLQLLANYKYDQYQRFGPGRQFIESLALWLNQFNGPDRNKALDLVVDNLIFISESEISHLVRSAYPDLIVQELLQIVATELGIENYLVGRLAKDNRFKELKIKSLYLGLSDGAHTSELRRASIGEIDNEQIWQAYELSDEKANDMISGLKKRLKKSSLPSDNAKFNLIWLLDDFSASGNTYIRYESSTSSWKGKVRKIYERLHQGDLVDTSHYEVYLVLYIATQQAVDHIEYWSERFTSEKGYKKLQLRVLHLISSQVSLNENCSYSLKELLDDDSYYDHDAHDEHFEVGGTDNAKLGFAACALPVVLSHNTPNNSVFVLWAYDWCKFSGLFPRVSRHREF